MKKISIILLSITVVISYCNAQFYTWQQIGLPGSYITALAINNAGNIFTSKSGFNYDVIYRSTNNGETWDSLALFWTQTPQNFAFNLVGHIYTGTSNGVYRSLNNGNSWQWLGLGASFTKSIAINNNAHIFAGTIGDGLYRSDDNGINWYHLTLTPTVILSLTFNSNFDVYAGTNSGVFYSNDNGDTWITAGLSSRNINSICIDIDNQIFAGTNNGEIFRSSNNGSSWDLVFTNSLKPIESITISTGNEIFASTWGDGIFKSEDNGVSWIPIDTGLSTYDIGQLSLNNSGKLFAGTYGDGIFYCDIPVGIEGKDKSNFNEYWIDQNYPNPLIVQSTIKFFVPIKTYVTLTIFDVFGKEIIKLIDYKIHEKSYYVIWDGCDENSKPCSNGIYFYQLKTESGYITTKRMIIVK